MEQNKVLFFSFMTNLLLCKHLTAYQHGINLTNQSQKKIVAFHCPLLLHRQKKLTKKTKTKNTFDPLISGGCVWAHGSSTDYSPQPTVCLLLTSSIIFFCCSAQQMEVGQVHRQESFPTFLPSFLVLPAIQHESLWQTIFCFFFFTNSECSQHTSLIFLDQFMMAGLSRKMDKSPKWHAD